MPNFCIVALDPGGTTGWASFTGTRDLPLDKPPEYRDGKFKSGHVSGEDYHFDFYQHLCGFLEETTVVVCESFEYRNVSREGLELASCEYIGVVKFFCQEWHAPLQLQTASMGKVVGRKNSFTKKRNLERLGLWKPGHEYKDEMDAYGHLLYYMINTGHVMDQELLRKGWKE